MCSYNKYGGSWACESQSLLTTLLKEELDFQGYVVSGTSNLDPAPESQLFIFIDWAAQHTTAGSANAGMVSMGLRSTVHNRKAN